MILADNLVLKMIYILGMIRNNVFCHLETILTRMTNIQGQMASGLSANVQGRREKPGVFLSFFRSSAQVPRTVTVSGVAKSLPKGEGGSQPYCGGMLKIAQSERIVQFAQAS